MAPTHDPLYGHSLDEPDALDGRTALHLAASVGYGHIVRQLAEAGADCTLVDASGSTPLRCAVLSGNLQVVEAILEAVPKEHCYQADDTGRTPLQWAMELGYQGMVELLTVSREANASPPDTGLELS